LKLKLHVVPSLLLGSHAFFKTLHLNSVHLFQAICQIIC
jgi:hypothetical protein